MFNKCYTVTDFLSPSLTLSLPKERSHLIDKQYNTDRDKLQKIRLLMVKAPMHTAVAGFIPA